MILVGLLCTQQPSQVLCSPDVVALLLEARAFHNRTTQDTCATPLLLAVADDHEEVVRLLLGAGASPDLTLAKTGTAPLHFAAENGQLELVRWEAGARYASKRHWYKWWACCWKLKPLQMWRKTWQRPNSFAFGV